MELSDEFTAHSMIRVTSDASICLASLKYSPVISLRFRDSGFQPNNPKEVTTTILTASLWMISRMEGRVVKSISDFLNMLMRMVTLVMNGGNGCVAVHSPSKLPSKAVHIPPNMSRLGRRLTIAGQQLMVEG